MGGLDKIIEKIQAENAKELEQIALETGEKVQEILSVANQQADAAFEATVADARRRCDANLEQAKSGAEAAGKKAVLEAKTKAVRQVMDAALASLKSLPTEQYFAAIEALVLNQCSQVGGVLRLNHADLARLPNGFLDRVNEALGKRDASANAYPTGTDSDWHITLGDPADIPSGFIMQYGDIQQNCTFEALLEENADEIKFQLHSTIFG